MAWGRGWLGRGRRRAVGTAAVVMLVGVGFAAGYAAAAPSNLLRVLTDLQNAQIELQRAGPHPSGYRQRALLLIAQAIIEVQQGMTRRSPP